MARYAFSMLERLSLLLDEEDFPEQIQHIQYTDHEATASIPMSLHQDALAHQFVDLTVSKPQAHETYISRVPPTIFHESEPGTSAKATGTSAAAQLEGIHVRALAGATGPPSRAGQKSHIVSEPSQNPTTPLLVGALANPEESFSPVMAISKFPYKFVREKELSERISAAFFSDAKFWRLDWDIFHIWPPFSNATKPLLLVPLHQVECFLDIVNDQIDDASLSLRAVASSEPGILLTFNYNHPRLRPRFLGHSFSQEQFNNLSRNAPGATHTLPGDVVSSQTSQPDDNDVRDCKLKIELGLDLCRSSKASKAAREEQKVTRQQNWRNDLKQVERFLGLRPRSFRGASSDEQRNQTWAEYQAEEAARLAANIVPPINPTYPPSYPFESAVVFISIDIECYERDKRKITEIGLSTIDTLDLDGIAPGPCAANWYSLIRSRHFRIREHAHLNNSDFVQGCAGDFRFGESEFIALDDAPKTIATCFRPPFSAPNAYMQRSVDERRTIILVGHDFVNDMRYMQRLGYDVTNLSTLHSGHPIADTQCLYRALTKQPDAAKLAAILEDFGVTPFGLHNAGNDAAYTMQAMLAIALRSAGESGSRIANKWLEVANRLRIAEAVKAAAQRALEEAEGWSSSDDLDDVMGGRLTVGGVDFACGGASNGTNETFGRTWSVAKNAEPLQI